MRRTKRCADPRTSVTKELHGLATRCGEPGCPEPLIKVADGRRTLNTRVAHIRASAPNGPRADPHMTCAEVNHFDNLLILCLFHATAIDEHVAAHPSETLTEWKRQQHDEATILNAPIELTGDELVEAVTTATRQSATTSRMIELAKAIRAARTTVQRLRREYASDWARREQALAATRRSMPAMWGAETGEPIDTSGCESVV